MLPAPSAAPSAFRRARPSVAAAQGGCAVAPQLSQAVRRDQHALLWVPSIRRCPGRCQSLRRRRRQQTRCLEGQTSPDESNTWLGCAENSCHETMVGVQVQSSPASRLLRAAIATTVPLTDARTLRSCGGDRSSRLASTAARRRQRRVRACFSRRRISRTSLPTSFCMRRHACGFLLVSSWYGVSPCRPRSLGGAQARRQCGVGIT